MDSATPIFLTLDEVLDIHRDQIERYGGNGEVLNRNALESALSQPRAMFGGRFLHGDIFGMAAAYLYHIAQNHPFADGNKRVAAVAAIVFLELNGIELVASEEGLEQLVMSVARGDTLTESIREFLHKNSG